MEYAEFVSEPLLVEEKYLVLRNPVGRKGSTMAHTDPIADMLTRIRNALKARKGSVSIPASKLKIEIARIMKQEGYIEDYKVTDSDGPKRDLIIFLKYGPNRERVINGLRRISKPGLRVYVGKDEIPILLGGMGTVVVSTSKGVLTGKEARRLGVGGEVICYIW
ncbi:MAG: small subunit ribosomal protein [Candidatus Atribacteria bacterium]|nr:small subunit ribosomal protein [Candidatus Atribacteria bacterium]MDI3530751.1 small subunit ribosomal protein [Candidatus Atribacteria bacterium]